MRHPYLVNCTGHTFRLTGYFPGPRQLNESRCGLRVTRDAFFHTKNDTEFARLALYLSKRQMRVQKGEFPEKHKDLVYSLMHCSRVLCYRTVKGAVQPRPGF